MVVVLGVTLAVGCGGSSPPEEPAATTTPAGLVRAGAPGSITAEEGSAVPLGIPQAEVIRRLGPPATGMSRKGPRHRCMLYDLVGQPPEVQLQFCFARGALDVVATYIGER